MTETRECLVCEFEIEIPKDEIFGGEVTCPKCGTLFEVDWDYTGEDSISFWLQEQSKRGGRVALVALP